MESNLETEKNAESKEETTSPKAVKTNVNWFDSKSVQQLSERLTDEFGKGFSVRTLQQMKKFYTLFPIANALRSQLTWTHYRTLLKVSNESASIRYIEEAIKGQWSSRQLDRQISTLYYERLLASQNKAGVIAEANANMSKLAPEQFIKDPRNYLIFHALDIVDAVNPAHALQMGYRGRRCPHPLDCRCAVQ